MMSSILYILVAGLILFSDQLTKYIVIVCLKAPYKLNKYISIDVLINRGISWGLLSSKDRRMFMFVSSIVVVVVGVLIIHMIDRLRHNKPIVGEVLVLAGGLSNVLDRIMHQGVVDFIMISFNGWSWPMFNLADCFIVLGVVIMFATMWYEH